MNDRLGTLTIDTGPGAGLHLHGDIPKTAHPGRPAGM